MTVVTSANLVMGPATLYVAPFSTTEPADSTVTPNGPAFIPASPWADVGATDGGVNLEIDNTYTDFDVDQLTMSPGARLTAMKMTVTAKLSEMTLSNMNQALNSIASSGSGSGYATLDIPVGQTATQPTYAALMIQGWAPTLSTGAAALRRVIVRKVLSQTKIGLMFDKKSQQSYDCSWSAYYISPSITPVHIVDELT